MKYYLIVLILTAFCLRGSGQAGSTVVETISGKIINSVTDEPVPYVNVGLQNTMVGVASNAEGNFTLRITKEMVDRNIFFSALGFRNDTFPVSNLFGREFALIKLQPQSYSITDIDIEGRSQVIKRILRMASQNVAYNYLAGPFNLTAAYKHRKQIADSVISQQNMDVLIYDKTGYAEPSKLDAYINRNYSLNKNSVKNNDLSFSEGTTNLDDLLEFDLARTSSSILDPEILDRFETSIVEGSEEDSSPVWIIRFKEKEPGLAGSGDFYANVYEGEIVINKDDYAIRKISGKVQSAKNNRQGKSLAVGESVRNYYRNVAYEFKITYSELKPEQIVMTRVYDYNGQRLAEESSLDFQKIQTTNLNPISDRQYFTGN